jgi:DNA uptake protein ComE-like DNA-binding protein
MMHRTIPAFAALLVLTAACSSGETGAGDTAADTGAMTADAPATTAPADTGLLDPNSASREQIAALPGMTPALADSLVAKRPFGTMLGVDSLLAGSLSEAQRDTIYARMFTPIALNTASDAEILLIPGIGSRMLREFKEYRPYDNIARFRREMGKYVDSTEVARMERYVRVDN